MSETRATVIGVDGDYALVQTEGGGCGRCHEAGGCGGANISQMFCGQERSWRVLNPRGAVVGEKVSVAVADGALRSGATLIYVVPLLFLILGAALGSFILAEAGSVAGAVAGLVGAWLWVARRIRQRHCDPQFQPHIL